MNVPRKMTVQDTARAMELLCEGAYSGSQAWD